MLGTNDAGVLPASGVDASPSQDSWVLPFTPEPGYIYTVTAQVTFNAALPSGDWVGAGFAQRVVTNAAVGFGRFSDGGTTPPDQGPNGYDWILTAVHWKCAGFCGAGRSKISSRVQLSSPPVRANSYVEAVLDTTNAQWSMADYIDGIQAGTTYTYPAATIRQSALLELPRPHWPLRVLSNGIPSRSPQLRPVACRLSSWLRSPSSVSLTNTTWRFQRRPSAAGRLAITGHSTTLCWHRV